MKEINNIKARFNLAKNYLNERTKRLWCATEAKILERGGIAKVSKATNVSRNTIVKGIKELENIDSPATGEGKIRKAGGGRKKIVDKYASVEKELLDLLEPSVRGEPQSPLLWTTKSLRNLSDELKKKNISISHGTVGEILKANNFSLQANRKTDEGSTHIDRDAQFNHIHDKVKKFQNSGNPVISIDAKKKELIGNFKNEGREWHLQADSPKVKVYDFPNDAEGKITPYGIYDITHNLGWVNVADLCRRRWK